MVVWLTPKGSMDVTSNTAVPAMEPALRSPCPSSSMTDELGRHLSTRDLTEAAPSLGSRRTQGRLLGLQRGRKEGRRNGQEPSSQPHPRQAACLPHAGCRSTPQVTVCLWLGSSLYKSNPTPHLLKYYSAKRTENSIQVSTCM